MRKKIYLLILFFVFGKAATAQTLGGNAVYNFLKFSHTPQLTALGGSNISIQSSDVGLAFNNPALLNETMHTQLNSVFNNFFSGTSIFHLSMGYKIDKLKTNIAGGIQYFDYGKMTETDASGNILGLLHPKDFVMQLTASRKYLQKWNYGSSLKFISSNYGNYQSTGMAIDFGLVFKDSLFSAAAVVKNIGVQLKKYSGTEELPFDLQVGVTKKMKDAPLSFSLTAQRLHHFNISYDDSIFNANNGLITKSSFFDNFFRHFIIAVQLFPISNLEISAGYNYLRRKELNIVNNKNGLNGFSIGTGFLLKKIHVRFAQAYYQNNMTYSQFGLSLQLNEYFGLGKFGERIAW